VAEIVQRNRLVLALQGGGALGAYQAGVLEALCRSGLQVDENCAASIVAVNAAIFLSNEISDGVSRLHDFCDTIALTDLFEDWPWPSLMRLPHGVGDAYARARAEMQNSCASSIGVPGFFTRRALPPYFVSSGSPASASLFDQAPLAKTLGRLCDFKVLNASATRLGVVASNVESGRAQFFDTAETIATCEMIMASGALPPWFPPVEVKGEWFWDGALVTAAPIRRLLTTAKSPERTIALRVDLWRRDGPVPDTLPDADIRMTNIDQASRSMFVADLLNEQQHLQKLLACALSRLTPQERQTDAKLADAAAAAARLKPMTVVSLDYDGSSQQKHLKDGQFGRSAIDYHWEQGRLAFEHALPRLAEALQASTDLTDASQ
jgi:NTE family protein